MRLVAGLGFEPRLTDPESAVLPLHHPAVQNLRGGSPGPFPQLGPQNITSTNPAKIPAKGHRRQVERESLMGIVSGGGLSHAAMCPICLPDASAQPPKTRAPHEGRLSRVERQISRQNSIARA